MRTCCTQWKRCGDANMGWQGTDNQPENKTNRGNQKGRQKQIDGSLQEIKQTATGYKRERRGYGVYKMLQNLF